MADLYTIYRPSTFDEVLGQESTVASLKSIIAEKSTLPSVILLSGPSGVGKTTIARVAAKAVGCEEHNIIEIDAASHTGVDDMREITERMSYMPLGGTKRVVIIDECQRLSKQAIDSVLKSTEEPPPGSSWVLCSTDPGKLPQTLKTRAHHYKLDKVPAAKILERLKHIASKEGIKLSPILLHLIATKAQGCPRQAIVYLSMTRNAETAEQVQELIKASDITESSALIDFCRALSTGSSWPDIVKTIKALEGEENESIRIVVVNYFSKAVLSTADDLSRSNRFLQILLNFSGPFNTSDKLGPVLVAAAKCVL